MMILDPILLAICRSTGNPRSTGGQATSGTRRGRLVLQPSPLRCPPATLVAGAILVQAMLTTGDASGQCLLDDAHKFTAAPRAAGDVFGQSVSVSGNTVLIGSPFDDERAANAGAAYVFHFDGAAWSSQAKLFSADAQPSDLFGIAVALSGDVAVVGAPLQADNGRSAGAAYVFRFDGATWRQEAKLLPSDGVADAQFASAVAIDGATIVIGAFRDDDRGRATGGAYVFSYDGAAWGPAHPDHLGTTMDRTKLTASDGEAFDQFGVGVAVSGTKIVVGAYGDDDRGDYAGAAYVFERVGGTWAQEAKLLATDGGAGQLFGFPVSISGDVILLGALADDDDGYTSGSAYVFAYDGAGWGPPHADVPGAVNQRAKLLPTDGANAAQFGRSVAIAGDTAIVGANLADVSGLDSGTAYVFARTGDRWNQTQRLRPRDRAAGWHFGEAVALDGQLAVVAAVGDSGGGRDAGSAYVFDLSLGGGIDRDCNGNHVADECEPDCNGNGTPDDCDIRFGRSLDCNHDGRPDECHTGVIGLYYPNLTLAGPPLTRLDPTIDFLWPSGVADARLATNRFSVRWITRIVPAIRDTYTFHAFTDDGVRLWVNRRLLIDHWEVQGPTERSGQVLLSAGTQYDLVMEYFNNGGPGTALLRWSSQNMPKQTIPVERFASAYEDDCNQNGLLDGCDAGDFDGAGSVDLADFAVFQDCFTGGQPLDLDTCCSIFDADYNGRLTAEDLALYFRTIGVPRN